MDAVRNNPWSLITVPVVDTGEWFVKDREAALRELERISRETQAAMAEVIGSMTDTRDKTASISRACRVSNAEALRRRKVASVCAMVPSASHLLQAGKISGEHLLALAPAMKQESAHLLLDQAVVQSPEDFRDTVQQFCLSMEHGEETAKRQHAQRHLRFHTAPDGMVGFRGLLPPIEGAVFKSALAAIVDANWLREHPERARTEGAHGGDSHEQRMADALMSLVERPGIEGIEGIEGTERETRTVTVKTAKPAVVIRFDVDRWSADMVGHGPVPVTASLFDQTRAELYYLFHNMHGEVLKFGRARKDPTPIQRLAVIARDRRCIFPGCTAPPDRCEIHHVNEYFRDQGATDVDVLGLLCKAHHRHIHTANLKLHRKPDGSVVVHQRGDSHQIAA